MNLIQLIDDQHEHFKAVASSHKAVRFQEECLFAKEALRKSSYLESIAGRNPESLKSAILNVAAAGITLNPVHRRAYLVPRDGQVCLDVGYLGMTWLAMEGGALEWIQCYMVRAKDEFIFNGAGKEPEHKITNPFGDRGDYIGGYTLAKTTKGDSLCHMMTLDHIHDIRSRSQSYKAYIKKQAKSSPWVSDFEEMAKKTIIKQAAKLFPVGSTQKRLAYAIAAENQANGIDFEEEQRPELEGPDPKEYAEAKRAAIDAIKARLTELTEGMDLQQKGAFLYGTLGVKAFAEFNRMSVTALEKVLSKLKGKKEAE